MLVFLYMCLYLQQTISLTYKLAASLIPGFYQEMTIFKANYSFFAIEELQSGEDLLIYNLLVIYGYRLPEEQSGLHVL